MAKSVPRRLHRLDIWPSPSLSDPRPNRTYGLSKRKLPEARNAGVFRPSEARGPRTRLTDREFSSKWAKDILRKMGYQDGGGLGALGQGITNMDEVLPKGRSSRRGVGAESGGKVAGSRSRRRSSGISFQKGEDRGHGNDAMDEPGPWVKYLDISEAGGHVRGMDAPPRNFKPGPCTNYRGLQRMEGVAYVGI